MEGNGELHKPARQLQISTFMYILQPTIARLIRANQNECSNQSGLIENNFHSHFQVFTFNLID